MGAFLRKYGVGTGSGLWIPIVKRGVVDFAIGTDWTPAAGDVTLNKDGTAAGNIGTLPVAVTQGNTAVWYFIFTDAELQCKVLTVVIADATTKAVEDQCFIIHTYGHASAMYLVDFSDAVHFGLTGIPNAAAGASGGLLISGSNAGTTTLAALTITGATTHTGNVAMAGGLTVTQSTTNGAGVSITGNGTGAGLAIAAGATGKGMAITTTAGDGLSILPAGGHAIVATGQGTSKHGIIATGGTAGTSDGFSCVAGTGGVPIRGDHTGSITGNLSGSVGSVTNDVGITQGGADKVWGTTARTLTAAGLDAVVIESGVNLRQAISVIAAAEVGLVSGADTGSFIIKGADVATTRIEATTDEYGNRSVVTLTLPT